MRIGSEAEPPAWRLSRMFAARGRLRGRDRACPDCRAAEPGGASPCPRSRAAAFEILRRPVARPPHHRGSAVYGRSPGEGPVHVSGELRSRRRRCRPSCSRTPTPTGPFETHLKERNYDALVQDAATYKQNFAYIAVFWANQKVDAALTISTRGLAAAVDLEAAALVRDDGAVEKAVAALADTCDACHKEHREQLPDKTYAIRL